MPQQNKRAEKYAAELAKLIQCATVSVKGAYDDTEFAKLRAVVEELFPLLHRTARRTIFSDDCWLYHIKGRNSSRCVLLMSHHDVAPVTGEWETPGFSGEIRGGRIWGRGTVDTKSSLYAELAALEELLRDGFEFPCDVYLASSHNEEIAGDGIPGVAAYFEENGIVPEFVLDEGGAVIDPPMAGITRKCAALAIHEKGRFTLELSALKEPSHGGFAGGNPSPALRMAQFMVRLQEKPPYIRRFSPQLVAMFEALAPHMQFPMRFVFSHLKLFSGLLIKIIPGLNAQAGAMLGTTGDFKELVSSEENGGSCKAKLSLRCIAREDLQTELERIKGIAAQYGISVTEAESGNEFHEPASMEGKAYAYVAGCIGEIFPEAIVMPFILPAGTDARHFSGICTSVFRFAPLIIDNRQFKSVHGVNENLCVDVLPQAVDFYKKVLRGSSVII